MVVSRQHTGSEIDGPSPAPVVERVAASDAVNIQRVEAMPPVEPAAMAMPTDAEPGASSTVGPETDAADSGESQSPKEMADELYPHIERRLRMSLLLERERKGALSDALWSAGGR